MKYCTQCKKQKKKSAFHKNRTRRDGLCYWCKKCAKTYREKHKEHLHKLQKRQRQSLKLEAITYYGGKCDCCGEAEPLFLTIDHINNDGASHRKKVIKHHRTYCWLKQNGYPIGFQVLCWNCNLGKQHNNSICPHQTYRDLT